MPEGTHADPRGALERENAELRARVAELEATISAILNGAVDALVVEGERGQQIFTREGAERSYRALVEDMGEGTITVATNGAILYCNQRFASMVGAPIARIIGSPLATWVASGDTTALEALLARGRHERCAGQLDLKVNGGGRHPAQFTVSIVQLDRELDCFCVTVTALSHEVGAGAEVVTRLRKRLEHERYLAHTDPLTGVLNRRAFQQALSRETRRCGRYRHALSLAYLDLDDFKAVNDRLGHAAGDDVLKTVATAITHQVRTVDVVARLGGDEFAVLLPEADQQAAQVVVGRLRQSLSSAVARRGWPVSVSIGVLTCEPPTAAGEEILATADGLMYSAKTKGKDTVVYALHPECRPAQVPAVRRA